MAAVGVRTTLGVAMLVLAVTPLASQTPSTPKPTFEVASIKQNVSKSILWSFGPRGDRFVASNLNLHMLIMSAYRTTDGREMVASQIAGGPGWVASDRFNIEAKPEGGARVVPVDQLRLMVQSLLEDRFQLKTHRETREGRVYELSVMKGGPKVRLSKDQTPPPPGSQLRQSQAGTAKGSDEVETMPRGTTRGRGGASGFTLLGHAVPIGSFINLLQPIAGRLIVDKTDLKGLVDFSLTVKLISDSLPEAWGATPSGSSINPEEHPGTPPASFFAAIEDQLGLRLESARAPVEVLVIDSVRKPDKN